MTPKQWAEATAKHLGVTDAIRVAEFTGRKLIGKMNDQPNPHRYFYHNALIYLNKLKG